MVNIRLTCAALLTLLCGCQKPLPSVAAMPQQAPAVTRTESATVNDLIQAKLTTAAEPVPGAWTPVTEDVQALAEQFAPTVVMPSVDTANPPMSMLVAPFRRGPYLALRYFVLYQDEDLKLKWEDVLYDAFRKQHYGSVVDIEPIEVFVNEADATLAGVAFKTGQNQDFYKVFVKENDWVTVKAGALRELDRDGDRPRIGVATWNHLHDLPSVLQQRPYAPTVDMPVVGINRLDAEAMRRWRFDRRHLVGGPKGDVRKLATDRSAP
jgi:hypothetical protein